MSDLKAVFKLTQFFFWCMALIPLQMITMMFTRKKAAYILPLFFHKMFCMAFQIQVETTGIIHQDKQTLYVGNHISYLDIPAISSVLPVSFVAKSEVASWPLFGLLAKLQQTVFINRARYAAKKEAAALQNSLYNGKSLVLFPEGTSSDGQTILPFKSALFSIATAENAAIIIQPFTIKIIDINGHPVTSQQDRDLYAWYGDMTLCPHLWNFAKSRGVKVMLHFHTPLQVKENNDRKNLAKICHDTVAIGLNTG